MGLRNLTQPPAFADDARDILEGARRRAVARCIVGEVPLLLVLWAMLRWERKIGLSAIEGVIGDCYDLELAVDNAIREHTRNRTASSIEFSHIDALENEASQVSISMGCSYVGSEHLLIALCRSHDDAVANILARFRIDEATIARWVSEVYKRRDA